MHRTQIYICFIALFTMGSSQSISAQISHWQLGGSGLAWSETDPTRHFVDFASTPRALHPTYFAPEENQL